MRGTRNMRKNGVRVGCEWNGNRKAEGQDVGLCGGVRR